MQFCKLLAGAMLAGATALAAASGAVAQQLPSLSAPTSVSSPNAAGGFGPTWLAASIAGDGTHVSGSGGMGLVSSSKINATGGYEVLFRRDISRCIVQGSIGRHGAGSEPFGFIDISQRSGNVKGYYVQTRNLAGAQTDMPFFLVAFCTT